MSDPFNHLVKDGDDFASNTFDLDDLLHPAEAFLHPFEVVSDPDLTLNEKRSILAAWACDTRAVEAASALGLGTNGLTVGLDEVMEALRALDRKANRRSSSRRIPSAIRGLSRHGRNHRPKPHRHTGAQGRGEKQ